MWRPAILQKAEAALLDEKANKLKGLAQVLDNQLGESFDAYVSAAGLGPNPSPAQRLAALKAALTPLTDRLAAAFQGVGLGYFDARLDQIVAYAPSFQLGYLVGVTPPPDHLGRAAMERRAVRIAIGSMVRGDALNCMHPLIRGGEVIGFTFANESVEDIYRQIQSGTGRFGQRDELRNMVGLSSLALFAATSALGAEAIRTKLTEAARAGLAPQTTHSSLLGALGQVERHVRLFLNSVDAGVVIVNDTGHVGFCNAEMSRFCGEQLYGRHWESAVARLKLQPGPGESLAAQPSDQHVVRCTMQTAAGPAAVDVLVAALPGLPGHRLLRFDPVDRTRREGDYFERAERLALAGELATAIAHEIRNPLTVVAGSIQLIPDRVKDEEFLLSLSRIAGQELARVNRIIQGLLGFARFAEPERTLVDLNEIVRQALEFLDWYAVKHNVGLAMELAPGELMVYGDGEHLQQALLNLMMNGIQAMEQSGGTLTVRTGQPSGSRWLHLVVEDQGTGIPPEALTRVWEVFYSSKPGGTGLGLPVVQRIIDAHRGYIEVDSVPGKGSRFTVSLPLANRPHLGREERDDAEAPAAGR